MILYIFWGESGVLMPSTLPHAAVAIPAHGNGHGHSHARGPAPRRTPAKVGGSALRASLGARLLLAAALSAVMWVAVALVVRL